MRLIDADNGILLMRVEQAKRRDTELDRVLCDAFVDYAIQVLKEFPTVDAEPVVHGHWKKEYKSGVKVKDGYVSSCCDMWNERKTRYCPNCGAKMDEVEK